MKVITLAVSVHDNLYEALIELDKKTNKVGKSRRIISVSGVGFLPGTVYNVPVITRTVTFDEYNENP